MGVHINLQRILHPMKVVIVGGVAGGASAAARLRRLDEDAEIVIIERTGFVSYANCGLPYYVGGTIQSDSKLTLQSPQSFRRRFDIDARVRNEVVSIDREAKTVHVRRLEDGSEYDESYDRLILSPGAKAIVPELTAWGDPDVMTLRTVEDAKAMREVVSEDTVKRAVVAGGGYIGLEVAENLMDMGVEVTIVQRPNQVMAPLDPEMAADLHNHLRSKGVELVLGATLEDVVRDGDLVTKLADGRNIHSDLVVIALGVSPDSHLAVSAGLRTGMKGSIIVDDHMRTSDPDIYAVGDAVQVVNSVTGEDALIALAGPANRQGRIAADNICGIPSTYIGSQGSSVIKVFDMTAASTGINEKSARRSGIPYDKVYLYSASHANYYPGARNMSVKVLFSPDDGRILGAQIVGYEGVDKRIDVLATAIRAGMTSDDLEELDLAYAPPYSSAKDPVNMAGFVIGNVRSGLVRQFFWDELDGKVSDPGVTVVDLRTDREYNESHLEGTLHIPLDDLRSRMDEIDRSKPVYLFCHSGLRSYIGYRILAQNGFDCSHLAGGFRLYSSVVKDRCVGRPDGYPCGIQGF